MADDKRAREAREERSRARQIGIYTAIPAVMLSGPLVGALTGKFVVDDHLGTGPWGLLVCLGFGLIAAFREVFNLIRLANEDTQPPPDTGSSSDASGRQR